MTRPTRNIAAKKALAAAVVGLVVGVIMATILPWLLAALAGWDAAALVYLVWTWAAVGSMSPSATASHALREDSTVAVSDALLLVASLASIAAEGVVMVGGAGGGLSRALSLAVALVSVVVSWTLVHTIFSLRYARLYYGPARGGIDFGSTEPRYSDFAYLAFTVGMCYQVSDTTISHHAVRTAVLRQAFISYLFGAVILAGVINLLAGLGHH